MSSWIEKIKEARVSEGGVYVTPGVYLVEIDKIKTGKPRLGGDNFIVTCKILASNNAERPVGSTMDWYVDMKHEPSPGNVKAFVMAAAGCSEAEVTPEIIMSIVGTAQPLKGRKVHLTATNIKTKAGKDFTKAVWALSDAPI